MRDFSDWYDYIDNYVLMFSLSALYKPVRIIFVNQYAEERLCYPEMRLSKMSPKDAFYAKEDQDVAQILGYSFREASFDTVILAKNGRKTNVRCRTKVIKENGKKTGCIICRGIDRVKTLEDEVEFLNEELVNQKEDFETLIDNLTHTQEQLVQSEKMAALGQLISGIAHEINTPLGAIKASVGNLSDSLEKMVFEFPKRMIEMGNNEKDLLLYLLDNLGVDLQMLSSKERRKLRRGISNKLNENNIPEANYFSDVLTMLGINEDVDHIIKKIKGCDAKPVFDIAKGINSLVKNKDTIHIAVEKASKVVFALKKFAHHDQSGEKVSSDIIDGIETVLTLYGNQTKHGIDLIRDFESLPMVECYFDEINQVWTNLIHNAIQAMGNKGTLTIRTKKFEKEIVVSVSDTGAGIEPELYDRIFEPFFTTKQQGEGSGIGLDIVKQIIEKHDGQIYFESEVGIGSEFFVKLPII
ncbi:ATP-binding protein [Bacteroidales bacterium]|nr:ATP-binding protein [Bacteroidales bacterium]